MSDIVEVMRRARDRWLRAPTVGAYARNENGAGVDARGPEAVCWCAYGALIAETQDEDLVTDMLCELGHTIRMRTDHYGLVAANDARAITAAHWDETIGRLEGTP